MELNEYLDMKESAINAQIARGAASGPSYPAKPLRFGQQVFEYGVTPVGEVLCRDALRVGKTNNALDIILIAAHDTEDAVQFAGGSSVTLTMLGCATPDGEFIPEGPSVCLVAPDEGIQAEADELLARFAIGNRSQWIKAQLKFDGSITGGKIDVALSYMPR